MSNRTIYSLIALISAILFLPFLGLVPLFDWDEINFAECSREMLVSGNYARVQVNFQPFWEKPPLFFWLQAGAMHLFGIGEYAARFPNALVGIATLLLLFYVGNKLYGRNFGLIWILAFAGSFLPHFYFKSGIIDPLFNLFIFLSIFQLSNLATATENKKRLTYAIWGGVFIGFAILTKGPVALLIVGACGLIYWVWSRKWQTFKIKELLLYALFGFLISSFWYLPETLTNGFWFISKFIDYQFGLATRSADTAHEQPFWYHPLVLLLGCFPASIYFLKSFSKFENESKSQKDFSFWMKLLFWVVLIIFSIIKAKIIHYSSLCYFPLTYLAARYIYKIQQGEAKYASWLNILFIVLALILSAFLIAVAFVEKLKPSLIPYIKDKFAVEALQAKVYWSGFEFLIGIFLLLAVFWVVFYWNKKSIYTGAICLFVASAIVLQLTIYVFLPKVERYSQGAYIDFLQSVQKEDAYIQTLNFHSYAQYFYGTVEPNSDKRRGDAGWLLREKIDKPAYLITKTGMDIFKEEASLKKIYEKNGYIVYKRENLNGQ